MSARRAIPLIVSVFLIATMANNASAATKLSEINFEQNLNDVYGYASPEIQYGGDPNSIVTYVPGHTGYAARSSHNNDDGGNDFVIRLPASFPASGELYIKWWARYESNYFGDCGGIWNVKWLWSLGGDHNELLFQYYDNNRIGIDWQSTQGASWDPGDDLKSGNFPYTFGNWMKIEIYFKLSSGAGHYNYDGIQWLKVNDNYIIYDDTVSTGLPGTISSPALKI